MKTPTLRVIFWVLLVLGISSLCAGIFIPLFFSNLVNEGLQNLWLKPDEADRWAAAPGKTGVKIVRSSIIFNITNVDEILSGGTAKLIEMPPATFQEYSNMANWEYQNQSGFSFHQDNAEDFVAFNANTSLISIPNNTTALPYDQNITSVNFLTYEIFYKISHAPLPLYMIPALYDVVMAMENDLYFMVLAYSAWAKYLSDPVFTGAYLTSQGLDPSIIIDDPQYGWGQWQTLRPWIECLFDYNATGLSNSFEILQMHFQQGQIQYLISNDSLLYELVQTIQADMQQRYGTNDRIQLGLKQWATASVTENLPLDLGRLSIPGSPIPIPTYLQLNTTFTYVPEIRYFQLIYNASAYQDFSSVAATLLQISYQYPRANLRSLLVLNNLIVLFRGSPQAAASLFGFSNAQMVINTMMYLGSMMNLPVSSYGVTTDGYSLSLSRLTRRSLVNSTVHLRNDAYWAVPTLLVFANFTEENKDCLSWVGTASICSSAIGWSIFNPSSWQVFELWVKAAFKGPDSQEFSILSQIVPTSQLAELLYMSVDNLGSYATKAMLETSLVYNCALEFCNYEELFYMQWSSGAVTAKAPEAVYTIVPRAASMMAWLPANYLVAAEWSSYSALPGAPLIPLVLSYSKLLSPCLLRYFYNTYFQGNDTVTWKTFNLPSVEYVGVLYQYYLSVIPGFTFFKTKKYSAWLSGYTDPFVSFVKAIDIYDGGLPIFNPLANLSLDINEVGMPRHVVRSGRLDTKKTKQFYKCFNSTIFNRYQIGYDETTRGGNSSSNVNVWAENITVQGGNGGQFGTEISDRDTLQVFYLSLYRYINFTHSKDLTYHDLEVSRFSMDINTMNTSATVPENAKFFQTAQGYDGFINYTGAISGAPGFVGLRHCYLCSEEAQGMVEYYRYDPEAYPGERIYPGSGDVVYADIEPLTGVAVRSWLGFEFRVAFYNDYFFKGFKEPVPGKGLYLPVFGMNRYYGFTNSMVEDLFGELNMMQKARKALSYAGVIAGVALIVMAIVVAGVIYRRNKYGSWKTPRNTLVTKYKALRNINGDGPLPELTT